MDPEQRHQLHQATATKATEAVASAREQAEADPWRPIYHVTAAARFINDPNGPIWHEGRYHVFFQHLPYWGTPENMNQPMWGHASSPDLVYWRHEPIALAPGPDGYDAGGIASGGCVVDEGVPTIIYTGFAEAQVQCLATSHDGMRTWVKDPANPVIAAPPDLEGLDSGFRDPHVWREGKEWRMLVGSGFKKRGGTVLLYRSEDLRQWEFIGPLCEGMGEHCFQWECPTFFPLGEDAARRHVLIVSPLYDTIETLRGLVEYAVGTYDGTRFVPGPWQTVDHGGPEIYYAPNSFEDPKGRRILWGWLMAGRAPEQEWCHCLTLPRIVTLAPDGTLRFEPAPELTDLRRGGQSIGPATLDADQEIVLADALGAHVEIEAILEPGDATRIELRLGRAADGTRYLPVAYDTATGQLEFSGRKTAFRLDPDERELQVRVFIDGMVGELYVNNRLCFSNMLPLDTSATGLSVVARYENGSDKPAELKRLNTWQMTSIWSEASAG